MKETVLITGASRGIGRAIARQFAENGYNVVVNYHQNREAADLLLNELQQSGCDAIAIQADIGDKNQVAEMIKTVNNRFGGADILVNNAGIAEQRLFTDITIEVWDRMFDVNVKGMFLCCQGVLPAMINKKAGRIINISSVWGITGASCEVHYSAAKAAVIGFTKALAKELGPSNIQVNCVAPGVIDTDMNSGLDAEAIRDLKEQTPLGVIGTDKDVAEIVFFLATAKSGFITGQVISPNGGFLI